MCAKVYQRVQNSMRCLLAGVLAWGLGAAGLQAQPVFSSAQPTTPASASNSEIVQTGCSSCSSGGLNVLNSGDILGGGCSSCGGGGCDSCGGCGTGGCSNGCCFPGQEPCDCCCDPNASYFNKVFCGFYQCVCCPDPCYEPKWQALADAAFFAEGPRPVTQMKLRYDHIWHIPFFDKAEFYTPRADGMGKGRALDGVGQPEASIREFYLINEAAVGNFSTWIAMPYRQISAGPYAAGTNFDGASGFSDMIIGTKSLLLDCELMQCSFGFRTFIPTGNFNKLLGTGHVSLEPAVLWALKCSSQTYMQAEAAYRIPIGGDSAFQGPVFHYHFSFNHMLLRCGCNQDIKLIGVFEGNGYHFAGGRATDRRTPGLNTNISAKPVGTAFSVGPGIRLVFCDKVDFGVGSAFSVTEDSVGDSWLRFEFRWRF